MADDAFALSPISARASMPTDADYEAICSAFMETARGRWFLGEYAKRNRNADTRLVLDAVARIEATLASQQVAADKSLAEYLPAITERIAETRHRILAALPKTDIKPATEPIQRAAGILRDVAWTLRESGADTRVCDLLDVQAKAIADGCARMHGDQAVATDVPATVAAALDSLALQISSLVAPEERSRVPPAAEPPQARPPAEAKPVDPPVAAELEATAAPGDAAPEIIDSGERAEPEPHAAEAISAPMPTEAPAAPVVAIVQTNLWDDLEIIDTGPNGSKAETVAREPDLAEPESLAEPDTPMEDTPAATVEPTPQQQPVAMEAEASSKPSSSSLGHAVLESGVVPYPASPRSGVLAPIRRMSQAEKIAFFS
jgi:hypothetical protein